MTANIQPREAIELLKNNWIKDPCWDLKETENFEAHRDELKKFQEKMNAIWEAHRNDHVAALAKKMGIPGNTELASYIDRLENRLQKLEAKVYDQPF